MVVTNQQIMELEKTERIAGLQQPRWIQKRPNKLGTAKGTCIHKNNERTGDPIFPHEEGDMIYRQIFQNTRGTYDNNFEGIYRIEAIG
jgi:hypothetical protein